MARIKKISISMVFISLLLLLTSCKSNKPVEQQSSFTDQHEELTTSEDTNTPIQEVSFTNEYGTATTKCAYPSCNSYITSSGDSNSCILHSQKCLECDKYIDYDASYCMTCILNALNK